VDQVCCEWYQPDPQETLVNISDTGHSTPDLQETLANISDTVHRTPDPQETSEH
jgi:hypothetical protein